MNRIRNSSMTSHVERSRIQLGAIDTDIQINNSMNRIMTSKSNSHPFMQMYKYQLISNQIIQFLYSNHWVNFKVINSPMYIYPSVLELLFYHSNFNINEYVLSFYKSIQLKSDMSTLWKLSQ